MNNTLILLIAPAAMIVAVYSIWRLYYSLVFGAGLLVGICVLNAATVEPAGFQLAGFHVYLDDAIGVSLAAAAILRLGFDGKARRQAAPWFGFAAATVLAFALGAVWNGVKAAGVEFRAFFDFWAAILYVASFPLSARRLKGLAGVWLGGCAALLALAVFRWSAELLHLGFASHWAMVGAGQPLRVLNAAGALFLAQGILLAIYYSRGAGKRLAAADPLHLFTLALAGAVILLQHRSVWVTLAVSAGAICYREGHFRKFAVATGVLAGVAIFIFLVASPQSMNFDNLVAESLMASIEEPFDSDHSTFIWRVAMWQEYLFEFFNLPAAGMLTGTAFGNQGSYFVDFAESAASAHNYYIFTLNRTGFLGLVFFAAACRSMWARLRTPWRNALLRWTPAGMFFGILAGQLAYFTVYSPSPAQGLLLGALAALPASAIRTLPLNEEAHAPDESAEKKEAAAAVA